MPIYKFEDSANGAPIFCTDATTGETGRQEYNVNVFFIDNTEAVAQNCPHTGWVRKTVGTGNKAGKVQWEVLAPLSKVY